MRNAGLAVVCILLAACGPDVPAGASGEAGGGSPAGATSPPVEGVDTVVNFGPGAWTDATRWHARVGLQLGQLDGEGPETFGNVGAVIPDSHGNLYVLETQAQEIRVFSSEGDFLRTVGREGQGPGELNRAWGLAMSPGDSLWVYDTGNARFTMFDPDGEFVRSVPRTTRGVVTPWPGGFDTQEGLIDWGLDRPGDDPYTNSVGSLVIRYPIRVDLETGAPDTLPPLVRDYELIQQRYRVPFGGLTTTAQSGNGTLWVAETERYELFKRTWAGDTLMVVTRDDADLQPVTRQDVDSVLAVYSQYQYPPGVDPPGRDDFAETKPVITRMVADGTRLFLMVDEAGDESTTVVDIIREADGVYLGQVTLPVTLLRSPKPVPMGRSLYGLILGGFDVPLVVRIDFREASGR